jgi:sigma-B regulation protein RsbU (phosphoserine phosphatase)
VSVRARLFLLLLALSVIPIVLLRVGGQMTLRDLSAKLIGDSSHLLVTKAKSHLLLMAEDHAELWRREGVILEQTLRLQTTLVQAALAGPGPDALQKAMESAGRGAAATLSSQLTVFTDGRIVAVSGDPAPPRGFDARQAVWYRLAVSQDSMVWTAPVIDPVTRRMGMTLSAPIRDASGLPAGVTALSAPLDIGGYAKGHAQDFSKELKTYLVEYDAKDRAVDGFRVIGEASGQNGAAGAQAPLHGMGHGRGMLGLAAPGSLVPDDPIDLSEVRLALKHGQSGVHQLKVGGREWLWAFAPARVTGFALVLAAPMSDATEDAVEAGRAIEKLFDLQLRTTLVILACALASVALIAWLAARSFTRPLTDLALTAARIGQGDLEARVTPSGGREFKELGSAFNEMIPRLKDHTRLQNSMALAREVHQRLLPAHLPSLPGLELSAVSLSCDEVGGDSYDVIEAARGDPACLAAVLGDVSGHGLDAALLMATARAFIRMRATRPGDPGAVISDVNRLLALDTSGTGRFMTLFYLEFDAPRGRLRWVRAGHDPAILYRAATDDFEELAGPGIPLGALEDKEFSFQERPWPSPGDILLLGSDGLWESRSPDGEMFGKERVRSVLRGSAGLGARQLQDALLDALERFRGTVPAEDDVTLLIVKCIETEASP